VEDYRIADVVEYDENRIQRITDKRKAGEVTQEEE